MKGDFEPAGTAEYRPFYQFNLRGPHAVLTDVTTFRAMKSVATNFSQFCVCVIQAKLNRA
jgi:hypothetical protein